MTHLEIRRWDTGEIIIQSGKFKTIRELFEDGLKNNISFFRADLSGANLSGVNLNGADLSGVTYKGIEIKYLCSLSGLYRYNVLAIVSVDGTWYVALGCHCRTVDEWRADFWNNVKEFPDDGKMPTVERKFALETAIRCIDIHVEGEK